MAVRVEWEDIQALVRRGMGWLDASAYVLLRITDPDRARQWLAALAITSGAEVETRTGANTVVNIAFTHAGLSKLARDPAGDPRGPRGFPREFAEGMAPPTTNDDGISRRSGQLGDVGPNAPSEWRWGGLRPGTKPPHILLMVFAPSDVTDHARTLAGHEDATGVHVTDILTGWLPADKTEHFGFRDGLSQPVIAGYGSASASPEAARLHSIAAGEFLIGYANARGNYPVSPQMANNRDIGRNGSYFILRELQQDVRSFEDWLDQASQTRPPDERSEYREWLAAKLVGRWKNGAPLTRYPDNATMSEDFGKFADNDPGKSNDFFYHAEDREGFRCPVGSHIRRAWPRDGLGPDPERSLLQANLHRILRRGRLFGPPYDRDTPDAAQNQTPRGLYFGCLNADIAGQFEAVQHNWINNPKFSGLGDERDPLLGERDATACMTIQNSPVNLRLEGLRPFVRVRGGGYFFLPGLRALQVLCEPVSISSGAATSGATGPTHGLAH